MKNLHYFKVIYIAFILCFAPILAFTCQENEVTKIWILNQPASPLKVTISNNKESYYIDNYSAKQVIGYRLGCVAEENGKIKIKRRAKLRRVNILPFDESQSKVNGKAYTIYADKDFYPCIQKKTKLAVLQINFSDGSSWAAKF